MKIKTIRVAMLCALTLALSLLSVGPALGGGPFVEVQEVPVWDAGHGGWCILRTTWSSTPNGGTSTHEQLIC